jgi:hypothetical protein
VLHVLWFYQNYQEDMRRVRFHRMCDYSQVGVNS